MTIRRIDRDYHSVSIITDDDEDELIFCEQCQKNGTLSKLKERIYLDANGKLQPPPPNSDNWLQCWKCNVVLPIREAKMQGKISN
jgi:hypothetical protein